MITVKAEFDGKVFIPSEPVDLPEGCEIEITIASAPPTRAQDAPSTKQKPKPEEETLAPAEFVWSENLYQARKAAQEFSKETHADY